MGASSWDDEEEEQEEMDLSGFVTSNPPQPPVIERKRSTGIGNAGPKTYSDPTPHFQTSNVGYADPVATNAVVSTNDNYTIATAFNPLWAHDNAWPKPRVWTTVKTAGIVMGIAGTSLAVSKSVRKYSLPLAVLGTGAYVHSSFGVFHGAAAKIVEDKNILAKGAIYGAIHGGGFYVFRTLLRKSRGMSWGESLTFRSPLYDGSGFRLPPLP